MPHDHSQTLTPYEMAEAEATRDVTDAEPLDGEVLARRAAEMPIRPHATDTELAHADCASDLSHGEPAR